jgi:hypothetical protein
MYGTLALRLLAKLHVSFCASFGGETFFGMGPQIFCRRLALLHPCVELCVFGTSRVRHPYAPWFGVKGIFRQSSSGVRSSHGESEGI